jgi:hypothetical protein
MAADAEGYGYGPAERGIPRLVDDLRTLSPAGIERAAWGWERHERDPQSMNSFHRAEKAALAALEHANRSPEWDQARKSILDLTEGRTSLVSWKAEHGDVGHRAERAALGAGLALVAGSSLHHRDIVALVQSMAEVLPWLLPESPPEPRRG